MKLRLPAKAAVFFLLLTWACKAPGLPHEQINRDNIKRDTEYLVNEIGIRPGGTGEERRAGDWIIRRLGEYGFDRIEEQEFSAELPEPVDSRNIIVRCNPGAPGGILDIVAHYDSVPTSPGARDNAASAAALLEMARILGTRNTAIPWELRLVFLGSEENGYWGSRHYVGSLPEEEVPRHGAAFNMDISAATINSGFVFTCNTLGGRTARGYAEGDMFEPAENLVSRSIREAHAALYGEDAPRLIPHHYGESDHLSFHQAGIDAANICWRESQTEPGAGGLPKEYHRMSDTAEHLDYSTIETTAACILYAARLIALESFP